MGGCEAVCRVVNIVTIGQDTIDAFKMALTHSRVLRESRDLGVYQNVNIRKISRTKMS